MICYMYIMTSMCIIFTCKHCSFIYIPAITVPLMGNIAKLIPEDQGAVCGGKGKSIEMEEKWHLLPCT